MLAGNLLSVPLLSQTAQVYGVGALAVPPWVDVAVPLAMLGLTGVGRAAARAARGPDERGAGHRDRAGARGRGRGYAAHRLLSGRGPWARLPRPVTLGLAAPFARPARTAGHAGGGRCSAAPR